MRHKELIKYLCCATICLIIVVFLGFQYPNISFILSGVFGAILIGHHIFVTLSRYRAINQLSEYLYRIYMGEYTLDVRDYKEGELSILKSEIYKLSLRLIEQNELLLKDKNYLLEALSDITHQLKTPLTSMSVMADLLAEETIDQDRRNEFIKNIHNEVEKMRWLVVSLLKMSKLDAKAIELKHDVIEVKTLINQSLESFLILAELKDITIQKEDDEKIVCIGDMAWLQEAIKNLIKNGLEHTLPGGSLYIQYSQNNLYTQISIQDTGEGIDKEDITHIFKRFYKGKNASSDSVGIGLALAKQIITNSNGSIHVVSETGIGTKFIVKLYNVTKLSQ